jgi:hypothetical protein
MKMYLPLRRVIRFRTSLRLLALAVLLGPALWLIIIVLFAKFASVSIDKNGFLIWSVTSLGLMVSTFVVLWGEGKKFSATVDEVQTQYKKAINNIERDVRRYVDTSIIFRESPHEMRRLLLPEIKRFNDSHEKDIVILGADALRPSTIKFNELQDDLNKQKLTDKDGSKTFYEYGFVFNRILAASSPKILRRYIYLFSTEELKERTQDFRAKYVAWLDDQVNFFRINQNYTIITTPRAPVWGAPKSIIFFENILAEVFFKGGGIVITSRSGLADSVVSATRQSLVDNYVATIKDAPPQEVYSQLNLGDFEKYITELRPLIQEPLKKKTK